jgi:hypothetical protein
MASSGDPLTARGVDPTARAVCAISGLGRIAIGVGLALAPGAALRALGFRDPSPATITVSRLAGGRDIVVGAMVLLALDDGRRLREATLAAAAVDAGDGLTFGAALGEDGTRQAALRGLGAAVPATLAGLWAASRLAD